MAALDILFQDDGLVVELAGGMVTMRCPRQATGLSFPLEAFAAVVAGAIDALDRAVEEGKLVE